MLNNYIIKISNNNIKINQNIDGGTWAGGRPPLGP